MSSIEHRRLPNGDERWRVRFRHDGKNVPITFDNQAAALSFKAVVDSLGADRALALARTPSPTAATVRRTVSSQITHHIDHLTGVEEGTRRKYRKIHAARFEDYFGGILLGDLTRDHVSAWVNLQEGAPKSIRNAHSLLSGALSSAVRDGLIPGNVAKGIRLPKRDADTEEHVYLTHTEFAQLLLLMKPHWVPFTLFLAGTGARFGEASAIRVRDLNLADHSARIRIAWKDTSGAGYKLGAPKTEKGLRTIGVGRKLIPMLTRQIEGRAGSDYVFTNTRGNPIRNGGFHETAWQPIMDEFEALTGKRPRVHDLRHTYASWAISARTPLPVIQRQLGHESIQTTVDVYGSLVRSDLDALALEIDRALPEIEA